MLVSGNIQTSLIQIPCQTSVADIDRLQKRKNNNPIIQHIFQMEISMQLQTESPKMLTSIGTQLVINAYFIDHSILLSPVIECIGVVSAQSP